MESRGQGVRRGIQDGEWGQAPVMEPTQAFQGWRAGWPWVRVPCQCTHMACHSRLGVRFLMSWSQSPSPPQLQAANVSCRLFICSIREIPGDVNGAPYAEHVPSMGPGSRVLTLDFMPTWLAVWKPLPAIKFLFLIPIRWLGWGPENPQLEVPLGIIPLMQLI